MKGGEVKVEKNGSKWKKMLSAATANYILLDIMTRNIDWDQRNLPGTKEKGDGSDTCRLLGENQKKTFGETNGKSAWP